MNTDFSSGNLPKKRAILPGIAAFILHLLRKYWLTEVTLLLVFLYSLFAGWSTPRQWSDGLFFAAVAQILIAWISMQGSSQETTDSAVVRYVPGGDINETHQQLVVDTRRKESFGFRAFIGGLLTLLLAFLALKV